MSIWMELRCEGRSEGRSASDNPCYSDDNSGPMLMAADTKSAASLVAGELFQVAKQNGWERRKEGWICPGCVANEKGLHA